MDAREPTLADLGEGAVLERIFPRLPISNLALLGPGDDAAILKAEDGRFVVTTDLMVCGPDFRTQWSTPFDLGWKAAASNLADVAAMGAVPTALVVAVAVPPDTAVSVLEGLADGLDAACRSLAPGCGVVGGDLSASDTFTIAVTAFGDLEGRAPVLRSGARVGQAVAVSGVLGEAARALRLLFSEAVDGAGEPDREKASGLRDRTRAQLAPKPPIQDGALAAIAGATAMLDLSDGLAKDAARVAKASGVAINFHGSALGEDVRLALAGGEDHSLLATFNEGTILPGGFRKVGEVIEGSGIFLDGEPYSEAGWDPYRDWSG
ncbi:MAG: thiamine-phosphate kinase [Microbacteriaceae bacterium]|nr:thiamine-phosphate kinase [Microbacteriaceae bacterium]